jgi:hypothetical protein
MSIAVPRALKLSTNPAGWLAAAGAVLAAVTMITNAVHHHGVINTSVIVAAVGAVSALMIRQVVTPVADPKDGAGTPLIPLTKIAPVPPGTSSWTTTTTVTPAVMQVSVPPVVQVVNPPTEGTTTAGTTE